MYNLILQTLRRPKMVKNRKRKIYDTAILEPSAKQIKLHFLNKRKFDELSGKPTTYFPHKKALHGVKNRKRKMIDSNIFEPLKNKSNYILATNESLKNFLENQQVTFLTNEELYLK